MFGLTRRALLLSGLLAPLAKFLPAAPPADSFRAIGPPLVKPSATYQHAEMQQRGGFYMIPEAYLLLNAQGATALATKCTVSYSQDVLVVSNKRFDGKPLQPEDDATATVTGGRTRVELRIGELVAQTRELAAAFASWGDVMKPQAALRLGTIAIAKPILTSFAGAIAAVAPATHSGVTAYYDVQFRGVTLHLGEPPVTGGFTYYSPAVPLQPLPFTVPYHALGAPKPPAS